MIKCKKEVDEVGTLSKKERIERQRRRVTERLVQRKREKVSNCERPL